jgi:hypothetical protein
MTDRPHLGRVSAMTPSQAISKLKQANAGSRDLDADFFEALGYRVVRSTATRHSWRYLAGRYWYALPSVTTDLTAIARRATGAGLLWSVSQLRQGGDAIADWPREHRDRCMTYAATLPLALCAVVLQTHLQRTQP